MSMKGLNFFSFLGYEVELKTKLYLETVLWDDHGLWIASINDLHMYTCGSGRIRMLHNTSTPPHSSISLQVCK
jgi:hypothetical protein